MTEPVVLLINPNSSDEVTGSSTTSRVGIAETERAM